jgi:integrase
MRPGAGEQADGKTTRRTTRLRKKGSGGIFPLREGVWRVDVELRRDPITGRRRRVSRTVSGTRHDAELALSRLRVADHERRLPSGGTRARSVGAAFQLYQQAIDAGLIELAPKTVTTVRSAARVMSAMQLASGRRFGDIRLSRLTWQDVEDLYAAMRAAGRSPAWVRRCATILTRTLELARKRGLLDTNPARDAARPRTSRTKPFAPSGKDVRALLARVARRDPEMADIVTLLVSTGMRKGELLALQWREVDLDACEVHVAASISDGGPGVGLLRRPTKTADWRDVPLTSSATDALERQLARRRASVGAEPPSRHYVFPGGRDGSVPMRPDSLADRWAVARGSSPVTLLHLRHYAATAMLDAGESFRTVADILGNSESTLRLHYDGRTDVGKRRAIAALELEN